MNGCAPSEMMVLLFLECPDNEESGQIKPELSVLSGFGPVTLTTIYQSCVGKSEETSKTR